MTSSEFINKFKSKYLWGNLGAMFLVLVFFFFNDTAATEIYTLVVSGQRFRKMKNVRRKFGQLKKVSYLWRNKMRPVAVVIYFSEYSE